VLLLLNLFFFGINFVTASFFCVLERFYFVFTQRSYVPAENSVPVGARPSGFSNDFLQREKISPYLKVENCVQTEPGKRWNFQKYVFVDRKSRFALGIVPAFSKTRWFPHSSRFRI